MKRNELHYHIMGLVSDLLSLATDLMRGEMRGPEAKKLLISSLQSWIGYLQKARA